MKTSDKQMKKLMLGIFYQTTMIRLLTYFNEWMSRNSIKSSKQFISDKRELGEVPKTDKELEEFLNAYYINKRKRVFWVFIPLNFIARLIVVPLFSFCVLVYVVFAWIRWTLGFVWFGGEIIGYEKYLKPKTILDVFKKVEKARQSE